LIRLFLAYSRGEHDSFVIVERQKRLEKG
jgi:hypothetical protein